MRKLAIALIALIILAGCASTERWLGDAQWYEANNYPDKAEEYYLKVIDKEPENAQTYYFLGRNKNRQTKLLLIERTRYSSISISDDPDMAMDRDSLRVINDRIRTCHQQAIEYFLRALELDPELNDAYYPLANSYYETAQYDMAIYYFEQILRRDPNNVQAVLFLGQCYDAKGDKTTARQYYQQAVDMGSYKARELLNS